MVTHLIANQILLVGEPRQTDVNHPVALGRVPRVQVHVPPVEQRLQVKVQLTAAPVVVRRGEQHQRKRDVLDRCVRFLRQQRPEAGPFGELL